MDEAMDGRRSLLLDNLVASRKAIMFRPNNKPLACVWLFDAAVLWTSQDTTGTT